MPYIKQEYRDDLDAILQQLWDTIMCPKGVSLDTVKGDINYCFFKLLITLVRKFGVHYATLSNIEAIPKDVEKEFHDQIMRPYEDRKQRENGVVKPLEVL